MTTARTACHLSRNSSVTPELKVSNPRPASLRMWTLLCIVSPPNTRAAEFEYAIATSEPSPKKRANISRQSCVTSVFPEPP